MTIEQFLRDWCTSTIAVLLLLTGSAINAAAQTAGDSAEPGDGEEPAAQTSDAGGDANEVKPTMPTLEQMLRVALEHNPDIRAARGEVAVAEANLDRTRLTVVKELTAYRDRWHAAHAELFAAEQELANVEEAYEQRAIPGSMVNDARQKVSAVQLKLREIEAEVPFLLGASPEDADELAPMSDVESRTGPLGDKAILLAEQILALSVQSYQSGSGNLERCLKWSSRLMQLQLDVADSDVERSAAAEAHLQQLLTLQETANARYRAAQATQEDVLTAEFAIVEAQMMLGRTPAE